jgi:hypothetical protein
MSFLSNNEKLNGVELPNLSQVGKTLGLGEEVKKILGYEVGSRLHEAWRATRGEEKTARLGREPRWKKTKDAAFISKAQASDVVKVDGETVEVDIANMSFEELPSDWQKDNLEAGLTATRLVMNEIGKEGSIGVQQLLALTSEQLEKLGDAIHEAWMQRTEKGDWNAAQFVPYSELPREEQEKDLDHVRVVMQALREVIEGKLSLEDLRHKYKEMDKEQQR